VPNETSPPVASLDPSLCLDGDGVIQTTHPAVVSLARELRSGTATDEDFAARAYEWVRDEVRHSWDAQDRRVTLTASEVLDRRVGLCYAKSHLLAAVLRSQGVPAALCYQRLGDDDGGYALHGLVAVHLRGSWHRQDVRGNNDNVDAQFSLGAERLAYLVDTARGEVDYPTLFTSAAPCVVDALRSTDDVLALCANGLPTEL